MFNRFCPQLERFGPWPVKLARNRIILRSRRRREEPLQSPERWLCPWRAHDLKTAAKPRLGSAQPTSAPGSPGSWNAGLPIGTYSGGPSLLPSVCPARWGRAMSGCARLCLFAPKTPCPPPFVVKVPSAFTTQTGGRLSIRPVSPIFQPARADGKVGVTWLIRRDEARLRRRQRGRNRIKVFPHSLVLFPRQSGRLERCPSNRSLLTVYCSPFFLRVSAVKWCRRFANRNKPLASRPKKNYGRTHPQFNANLK